jgi:hypothetical protein
LGDITGVLGLLGAVNTSNPTYKSAANWLARQFPSIFGSGNNSIGYGNLTNVINPNELDNTQIDWGGLTDALNSSGSLEP